MPDSADVKRNASIRRRHRAMIEALAKEFDLTRERIRQILGNRQQRPRLPTKKNG